jgi:hypothetical protein
MNEFMQPINAMRITTGSDEWSFKTPVFAIAVQDEKVTYLTINGNFYTPDKVKFAEMNINGQWVALESHKHRTVDPNA